MILNISHEKLKLKYKILQKRLIFLTKEKIKGSYFFLNGERIKSIILFNL